MPCKTSRPRSFLVMAGMVDDDRGQDAPAPIHTTPRPPVPEDLALALDAAPVGIAITDARDPAHPVLFVNRAVTAMTGYEPAELRGRNLRLLQGPDTDPAEVARLRDALARGEAVSADLVNYRKSGEAFWMRSDIRPVHDETGRVVTFVGTLTDLTGKRRAEESARQSETRLRAFTDAIPLPMLTVRLDGTILRANQTAERALGVPPGSLIGLPVDSFAAEDEDLDQSLCHVIQRQERVEPREIRARRADGSEMWVLGSAQRFKAEDEDRYVLVFQDVTELKQKERRLTEANEEAERNIRARMRFLAAASHDLRQPLQAMALFASALDHHVASAQGRTVVQSLKASLRSMEEMFDSLLDMSKLDAGVMKAEPRVFLINDIFEQLEMTYGPQAEAAGLKLTVVPSSAAVRSDPRLLARIVGNFLSNAIRYTRRGRVTLGVRRRGNRLRIVVYDTGPGIPENQRLEIFREFRQGSTASTNGRSTGMGLGLAIVQRLSRLLGHALDVRSTEGKGSAFAIEVPQAEEFEPGEDELGEDQEVADVSGMTVVVVDDDRDIQEGLCMLLEEWGCHAIVASTAEDALAKLQGARPDVIIADLHLHGDMAGVAAIAHIRQHSGVYAPAFLFTGDTGAPAEIDDAKVLRKPLDPMRLRMLLGEVRSTGN